MKLLLCPGDDIEVIHIPAIETDAPALFNPMVEVIKKKKGEKLTCLVSEGQALGGVDVDAKKIVDFWVNAPLLYEVP